MTTYRDRHIAGLYTTTEAQTNWTLEDYKAALTTLGQPTSGNKAELEKRHATALKQLRAS